MLDFSTLLFILAGETYDYCLNWSDRRAFTVWANHNLETLVLSLYYKLYKP